MNYDTWLSTEPDDPYSEPPEEPRCPDCGAPEDMPCELTCGCKSCRARELDAHPTGDEAA